MECWRHRWRTLAKFRLTCVTRRLKWWAWPRTWRQAKNFQLSRRGGGRGRHGGGKRSVGDQLSTGNERRRDIRLKRETEVDSLCCRTRWWCHVIAIWWPVDTAITIARKTAAAETAIQKWRQRSTWAISSMAYVIKQLINKREKFYRGIGR